MYTEIALVSDDQERTHLSSEPRNTELLFETYMNEGFVKRKSAQASWLELTVDERIMKMTQSSKPYLNFPV